jgi:hypothetical protein
MDLMEVVRVKIACIIIPLILELILMDSPILEMSNYLKGFLEMIQCPSYFDYAIISFIQIL